ncbi:MAG TPA: PKD domain-containing protein, partial [Flavobacteriales bacterium]|nr:PKD domain-containing protein [Flavobacteriales bacterium]
MNATVSLDGTASIGSTGAAIVLYAWDLGDGTSIASALATHSFTDAGRYTARLVIMDDVGCSDTSAITLFIGPLPTVDMQPHTTICLGDTVSLV